MDVKNQSAACFTCKSANKKLYSCIQCNNFSFCNDCWSKWPLHVPGSVGFDGRPHEKAIAKVVETLRSILEPSRNDHQHDEDLLNDDDTTWFGVGRGSADQPVFQDHGRFANLMSESQTEDVGSRYPRLVSFIGQTGAGKSTLIKMLIDRLGMRLDQGSRFPSPVTSSSNDRVPTTGDVHLYADPSSYYTKGPILYADCEGLDGGEAIPKGLKHRVKENVSSEPESTLGNGYPRKARTSCRTNSINMNLVQRIDTNAMHVGLKRKMKKNQYSSERDIAWAITPETKKREYAVTQLYPRLLYTFSDVVVFVLKNPRAFESTMLEKLLQWGSSSIDKSLNQPALPHAILVLNATEMTNDNEWNIETATNLFLEDIKDAIFREPRFSDQIRMWKDTGRDIRSTRDLLECYYASITVVRIPSRGRYMLMDEQAGKLFESINRKCQESLCSKKSARMLATAEELQRHLQAAYDHFSKDLTTPFDFIKEALRHNPIPLDFGGNILNLAVAIKQNCSFLQEDTEKIFDKMVPMVSSCIMLDAVRQNLMGSTIQLLDDAYVEFCRLALEEFADFYSRCTFTNYKYGRCCNVKVGHNPKGHQSENGKIIGQGDYRSNFDHHEYAPKWIDKIKAKLEELHHNFVGRKYELLEYPELNIAAEVHEKSISEFYRTVGNAGRFKSHTACFSCLRELPEHPLPCGHVLCLPCVKTYGVSVSKTTIEIQHCPLHPRETYWEPPKTVMVKPAFAGTRILCLDGGGMRGIVELRTLQAIEKILGPKLPIQNFFDLIAGTSTGGIIALGLGVNNWTVDECIRNFKELCGQAFRRRGRMAIPGFEKLALLSHHSRFKTTPFEELLQKTFTEKPLFGGANGLSEMVTKVAVTTTSEIEQHAVVLANYNRQGPTDYGLPYRFDRYTEPEKEFRVWEAARATSAAPTLFKVFQKRETMNTYLDGALYHNNPVWVAHHERKLIWPDVCNSPPDILLSIGTGKNTLEDEELPRQSSMSPVSPTSPTSSSSRSWSSRTKPKRRRRDVLPHALLKIAIDRLDNLLECNKIWDSYVADTSTSDYSKISSINRKRSIRLNPDLRFEVPRLDAVEELERVEIAAMQDLKANKEYVVEVAHRLIASTFFFEKDSNSVRATDNGYECTGRIYCRFMNSSVEMKGLGDFLWNCLQEHFEPFFVVEEDSGHPEDQVRHPIDEHMIEDMCVRGRFDMPNMKIHMSKELAFTTISLSLQSRDYPHSANSYLPISGFPRQLVIEDKKETVPKPRPRSFQPRHNGNEPSSAHYRFLRHLISQPDLKELQSENGIPIAEMDGIALSSSPEGPSTPNSIRRRQVQERRVSSGESSYESAE
ncbi:FabD/lysophospholipase-like protein [Annulohypoxylon stygium]|nr:FabD/lysophospholipase-like protein [Annulohypoxylon stygium]